MHIISNMPPPRDVLHFVVHCVFKMLHYDMCSWDQCREMCSRGVLRVREMQASSFALAFADCALLALNKVCIFNVVT